MKRGWTRGVAVALAGVLTGFWLGQPPGGERNAMPETKAELAGESRRFEPAAVTASGRTYEALVRQFVHAKGLPAAGFRHIERATNRELRGLMLSIALEDVPSRSYQTGSKRQRATLHAAATELFRREGAKSLEWAAEQETLDLSLALMTAAAGQDPDLMKEWLVKFGDQWEPGYNSAVIAAAEREAALRSAEDLLAVESLFSASLSSDLFAFAEGFDFRAYLNATQSSSGSDKAYRCWAAQDPEAAARGLREGLATNSSKQLGRFLLPAMEGRAEMSNDAAAAEWICGIVADLSGAARDEAIQGLTGHHKPSLVVMRHLPSDSDRVLFAATSLLRDSTSEHTTSILEALPSRSAQVEAVGRWVEGTWDLGAATLDEMMERLDLPEDQREDLRAKLPVRGER